MRVLKLILLAFFAFATPLVMFYQGIYISKTKSRMNDNEKQQIRDSAGYQVQLARLMVLDSMLIIERDSLKSRLQRQPVTKPIVVGVSRQQLQSELRSFEERLFARVNEAIIKAKFNDADIVILRTEFNRLSNLVTESLYKDGRFANFSDSLYDNIRKADSTLAAMQQKDRRLRKHRAEFLEIQKLLFEMRNLLMYRKP